MYEARQHKDKVSRRIDGSGKTLLADSIGSKEKNIVMRQDVQSPQGQVIQGKFHNKNPFEIIGNYQKAAKSWTNATECVIRFCKDFESIENNANTYGNLEQNIYSKSLKAYTTCAGESFEPYLWRVDKSKESTDSKESPTLPTVIGPGGGKGDDLKSYKANSTIGTKYGEVKSSVIENFKRLFKKEQLSNVKIKKIVFLADPYIQNVDSKISITDAIEKNGFYIYSREGTYVGFLEELEKKDGNGSKFEKERTTLEIGEEMQIDNEDDNSDTDGYTTIVKKRKLSQT